MGWRGRADDDDVPPMRRAGQLQDRATARHASSADAGRREEARRWALGTAGAPGRWTPWERAIAARAFDMMTRDMERVLVMHTKK